MCPLGAWASRPTLAGVLALRLILPDARHFPARDLAVLLTAAVILVSRIFASVGLPLVVPRAQRARQAQRTRNLSEEEARRLVMALDLQEARLVTH